MARYMVAMQGYLAGVRRQLAGEEGFQTAEAIGIAAVGIVVLSGIMVLLEVLGVDVVNWMRGRFGVGS